MLNLENIELRVLSWGTRKLKLDKLFDKVNEDFMYSFEKFPEAWTGLMYSEFFMTKVLANPVNFNKFHKAERDEFSPSEEHLLKLWRKEPPVWSLFLADQAGKKNEFEITDYFTGEKRSLFSPAVNDFYKEEANGCRPFLAFLVRAEAGWETYGIVRHYKSYRFEDFTGFISFLDQPLFEKEGLTGIISKYFAGFLAIDRGMELPEIEIKGEPACLCWSEIMLPDFDPAVFKNELRLSAQEDDFFKFVPYESTPDAYNFELYFEKDTEEVCMVSTFRRGYDELVSIIGREYVLDPEPDYCFSLNFYATMLTETDVEPSLNEWFEIFLEAKAEEEEDAYYDEVLDDINDLFADAAKAYSNGEEFDFENRASQLGLSSDIALEVQQLADKFSAGNSIEIEGGFEYPVPPPAKRLQFDLEFDRQQLFLYSYGKETEELFFKSVDEQYDESDYVELDAVIEEEFFLAFEDSGTPIMNSWFYMMCHKHDQWISVRDYAVEILKLFGHIFLPMLETDNKGFITELSRFAAVELKALGLIDIEAAPRLSKVDDGNYKIKPSKLFRSFIHLNRGNFKSQ
ncbi:MAG: hypothetical protein JEZ04_10905 [Spirochaetales bacterium]|nr:hypothetical protein [Spirochaetales bacterium]